MRKPLLLLVPALVAVAACSLSKSPAMYELSPPREAAQAEVLPPGMNTESYGRIDENPFLSAKQNPLSTFSIDVDTASYSNVRRFLTQGQLPPKDAVRIEELVNYFPYGYAPPTDGSPFAVYGETLPCPWMPTHRLVRLGIKGRELAMAQRPRANLVFLIDVSGSMFEPNKLPLVKQALKLLVEQLREDDRIALAVYAGNSGLVLPSTSGAEKRRITDTIDALEAGGSTNGAAGIELAYQAAKEGFIEGGINRVILATDGDFNVGTTDEGSLTRLIEEKAKGGVFLTVLGFGMGNYKDSTMVKLADRGNGNYAYIDTLSEARKVLVEQAAGTLVTIAKDVKLQVEFNPARVDGYRLIGYEKRLLRAEDFNDDKKDAGELGAGHVVTALYEVALVGSDSPAGKVDALRYQSKAALSAHAESDELLTLKIRSKEPSKTGSTLQSFTVDDTRRPLEDASPDARFAAAVAEWGMLLRDSPNKGQASFEQVASLAQASAGSDSYRREFVELVRRAQTLSR